MSEAKCLACGSVSKNWRMPIYAGGSATGKPCTDSWHDEEIVDQKPLKVEAIPAVDDEIPIKEEPIKEEPTSDF